MRNKKIKERKHKYLVGYPTEGNVVYGKDKQKEGQCVEPMTLFRAKKYQKIMPCKGAVIFEIKLLSPNKK